MDSSSSNHWCYPNSRQQRAGPSHSHPPVWQHAQDPSVVGTRHAHRAYQNTVEDTIDKSGMCYGSGVDSHQSQYVATYRDPYAWARDFGGAQLPTTQAPLLISTHNTLPTFSARRSFVEPHATFSPPSLVSGSSTLSSTSSNFSATTPAFDQPPCRRSSQQAFPDQIDRDALARANKRMAATWPDLSDSPFNSERYNPFAPLQPSAPFASGNALYTNVTSPTDSQHSRRDSAPSMQTSRKLKPQIQPQSPSATLGEASAFKTYLNSELNRRAVADKTVLSIRSARARALAQAKEDARRTDWARNVLLKFPMQCALAESLRPEDMMASIARSGVFELTASMT